MSAEVWFLKIKKETCEKMELEGKEDEETKVPGKRRRKTQSH